MGLSEKSGWGLKFSTLEPLVSLKALHKSQIKIRSLTVIINYAYFGNDTPLDCSRSAEKNIANVSYM